MNVSRRTHGQMTCLLLVIFSGKFSHRFDYQIVAIAEMDTKERVT